MLAQLRARHQELVGRITRRVCTLGEGCYPIGPRSRELLTSSAEDGTAEADKVRPMQQALYTSARVRKFFCWGVASRESEVVMAEPGFIPQIVHVRRSVHMWARVPMEH